ncbi:reactivating factor of adenosylcobalamin-dependent ethanolamine ammonia lyase [Natranaerovirga hydrolytica]|uniref:Reactivating factor of adenosylcobalamin-dependent ethanolamine ammonia lyase n=1 Tax=Natranaerovirga hydrolytica TaxID=680378 RepID=A0A4R1N1L2_9FIRM|nr:ethanolamine ammonia-lyase reactivating factor EutA [Natranaerovirga hydrolytica]TCK98802.1 reactivating factor of adenosylcobalamin-dependent ethanolamine ammonia lyase [Natranaerovirga hydrolytica]
MDGILNSIGIDMGTSTTQIVFSKLSFDNTSTPWTVPKFDIINREVWFKSPIYFTPVINNTVIDIQALKKILEEVYHLAGIEKMDIQTGAVIITGETARKSNAKEVLNVMSGYAGDFVVATAGPDFEGILAGKGSGACEHSRKHSCTVMNLDIGGGTTNIAVYSQGEVIETGCFDIGGRLIRYDSSYRVTFISHKAKKMIQMLGLNIQEGKVADKKDLDALATVMATLLLDIIKGNHSNPFYKMLVTNKGVDWFNQNTVIFLSGGVAECVKKIKENKVLPWDTYGDIGLILGHKIFEVFNKATQTVRFGQETIGATVVGAGNHTTEVSGSTIYYHKGLLPIKNIPLVHLTEEEELKTGKDRVLKIKERIQWMQEQGDVELVALSIRGSPSYEFNQVLQLAQDIVEGLDDMLQRKQPLVIISQADIGKALGMCLASLLTANYPIVCIDAITALHGDYVDIGRPLEEGSALPVVIKTLVFERS